MSKDNFGVLKPLFKYRKFSMKSITGTKRTYIIAKLRFVNPLLLNISTTNAYKAMKDIKQPEPLDAKTAELANIIMIDEKISNFLYFVAINVNKTNTPTNRLRYVFP